MNSGARAFIVGVILICGLGLVFSAVFEEQYATPIIVTPRARTSPRIRLRLASPPPISTTTALPEYYRVTDKGAAAFWRSTAWLEDDRELDDHYPQQ